MDYKDVNDYEVIYYIGESDDEALSLLLKKYEPKIKSICKKYHDKYKYIGIDFDDLYQEGLIAAYKAIRTYNDDNSLIYTYLQLICDRHLNTYCRNFNTLKNYPLNYNVGDDSLDFYHYDLNDKMEDILNDNEKFFEIKNHLDFKLSLVFELYYNNFNCSEISDLLGVSIKTIYNRLYMIRQDIRNNFKFTV